ncbi:peptidoglycan DD-metalloendopeptidase family protein [Hyphomicrobium sp. LHD-15]|uniref:peptidoglycan DD-metalloendopeptidase family protein n=1 Tax=Hyphomicrobium sp. LHD-15 TaxID=3072142 RepID=UPI00280F4A02|nr:peptidoglycan DD-metalloendopeptidase family protein [Hyphomicrobium sp. LHD-15]MDQ8700026.1 peptidoglycan DD-metalloendopeptidase family protein [Hyphomicrobium sp. LHD-15]
MLSSLRKCQQSSGVQGLKVGLIFSAAAVLAGCSADIARFDLGNPEGASAQSNYGSTPGRQASNEFGSAGYDRPAYQGSSVQRSELPRPQEPLTTSAIRSQDNPSSYGNGQQGQSGYGQQPQGGYGQGGAASGSGYSGSAGYDAPGAYRPSNVPSHNVAPIASRDAGASAGGESIEVRPGDTLYSLSRRHNVSVNEMMAANGLSSPNLKPGQQLHLPSGVRASRASETARPPREAYDTAAAPAPAQTAAADAPSDWTGSYTVRSGDSLYAIARQNNVKLAELERYNGISDSRKVKPGTVLKLPANGSAPEAVAEVAPAVSQPSYDPAPSRDSAPRDTGSRDVASETPAPAPGAVRLGEVTNGPAPSSAQQPTLLNGSNSGASQPPVHVERVARAETPGAASDAVSPSSSQNSGSVAGSRLRWPVAGKIIAGFGPRPDGTHNDGVNFAAPMGTDIHAAENGVVAYSGDELKGYGNLVLIRHDNGWVTAYAHADEILVKRGDRIKRGQVIAKAGRTGQVDQPQVHFELRQGQKPVDPTPFMERL